MITGILSFALSNWRWLGGALAALLLAGMVWGHFHHDAKVAAQLVAAEQARDGWRNASDRWSATALGWRASFRAAEGLRGREHAQAVHAIDAAAQACDARVAEARRSAIAIHTLVNKEPAYDADHCPVRSLLDPGQLRDALGAH